MVSTLGNQYVSFLLVSHMRRLGKLVLVFVALEVQLCMVSTLDIHCVSFLLVSHMGMERKLVLEFVVLVVR